MELFTLTKGFIPNESVDDFTSAIWTERYSAAGDVQLVVPPTKDNIKKLKQGTFLGLRGTKEIMILETHSLENGLLTVTGSSLIKFLNERQAWFRNTDYDGDDPIVEEYVLLATTAGQIISEVINKTVIDPSLLGFEGGTGYWIPAKLDFTRDKITGLELGKIDDNGTPKRLSISLGPLYESIQKVANDEDLGLKLYLDSATYSTNTYVLKFATYRGRNRTSEQFDNSLVRLTPKMDSLSDVKELTSISNYKNVVYVMYKNQITTHYIDPALPIPEGFDRRTILVEAPDIELTSPHVTPFRAQVARNAIANHIYIQAVDGQVTEGIGYKFTKDYYLGDVIELEGYSGLLSKAQITEYIRTQDQFGDREYPTLSVIDPLETGYMPDLEPNPPGDDDDFGDGSDPDFDLDPDPADPLDPSDPESDPGLDPFREKKPKPPKPDDEPDLDPNKDPEPDFGDEEPTNGNGDGDGDGDGAISAFLIFAYYPDPDTFSSSIGKLEDGEVSLVWAYPGEDPENDYSTGLYPRQRMPDKRVIVVSEEIKGDSDDYPWGQGYVYWRLGAADEHTRLTETLNDESTVVSPGIYHHLTPPGTLWFEAEDNLQLFIKKTWGTEIAYGDGTYQGQYESTGDPAPPLSGHGPQLVGTKGPIEVHRSTSGNVSDLEKILGAEDFPPAMRWSDTKFFPSPDGSKLLVKRMNMRPSNQFTIQSVGFASGGSFTLSLGTFGSLTSVTTAPIPYDATAEQIWNALKLLPLTVDPRINGYPANPWNPATLPAQCNVLMDHFSGPEFGFWMSIDNSGLIGSAGGLGAYGGQLTESPIPHWFLCDPDGSNLEEISFGVFLNEEPQWSPDSSKLHGLVPSSDGHPFSRWLNYDIATEEVTYPLVFDDPELVDENGYGPFKYPVIFSPDGEFVVFMLENDFGGLSKTLYFAPADGSSHTIIHHQTVLDTSTDQDAPVLSRGYVWNFDSNKIAVLDNRDPSPIWVFDLAAETTTKVWGGAGWSDSSEVLWISDLSIFDG